MMTNQPETGEHAVKRRRAESEPCQETARFCSLYSKCVCVEHQHGLDMDYSDDLEYRGAIPSAIRQQSHWDMRRYLIQHAHTHTHSQLNHLQVHAPQGKIKVTPLVKKHLTSAALRNQHFPITPIFTQSYPQISTSFQHRSGIWDLCRCKASSFKQSF